MTTARPTIRRLPAALAALSVVGCAVGHAGGPDLAELNDEVVFVGSELRIELQTSQSAHGPVRYAFESDVPELCRAGRCRAGIERGNDGSATFRWKPRQSDVGIWRFRFLATDGKQTDVQEIRVEVRSSVGYNGVPVFVQPLGTGSTLDLRNASCFEFDAVVHDPDSPEVQIAQEPPGLEGAELQVHDSFTATWRWCPTASQIRNASHFDVTLSATDGDNPKTFKDYTLVVQRPSKPGCSGEPPHIEHSPADWHRPEQVEIVARVTDDLGLKRPPLLYYSTTPPPSDGPDLSRMIQLSMRRGERSGEYRAPVANPAASLPAGESARLYYVIVATDNDSAEGGCDNRTQFPHDGAASIEVVAADPEADPKTDGATACEPCTADRQCGGSGDLCARMGSRGDSFCLAGCGSGGHGCPEGFVCSDSAVDSVDGASGRQCVPEGGSCGAGDGDGCADDAHEDNDDREAAHHAEPLAAGEHDDLVSCNGEDEHDDDWYRIEIDEPSQLEATLAGGNETDLDLALVDEDGELLAISDSLRSTEEIAECVGAGTYYLWVHAFGEGRNEYRLGWSARPAECGVENARCVPDDFEADDDAGEARRVDLSRGEYRATDNTLCSGNEDWFRIELDAGQTFAVDLTFIQTSYDEDLDLKFLDGELTNLTPCSESDPSTCSSFQGQSVDSDEYYEHTAEASGVYYLVVWGFAGAENNYDIRLWVED